MRSFWGFIKRFFGAGQREPGPPATVARRSQRIAHSASASTQEFDLRQVGEYPPGARKELSGGELLQLETIKVRVAEIFQNDKAEIAAFPSRAAHILRILDEPDFDIGQLVQITQRDPAISASILRAANSAAFAGVTRIDNMRDAVIRLGAQTVAGIATAVTARGLFDGGSARSSFEEAWSRLWLHSVTTAFAAGGFASSERKGNLERCFLGGMLHDIGKTFVLRALGSPAFDVALRASMSDALLAQLMEDMHVEFGSSMAKRWNLPDFVIEACAQHHDLPEAAPHDLNIIRVVSGLDELSVNPQFRHGLEDDVLRAARRLGMDGFALRALSTTRRQYASQAAAL